MKRLNPLIRHCLTLLTFLCTLWVVPSASAQSQTTSPQAGDSDDITRRQLASMDQFFDQHNPALARQLRDNPSLINDEEFLKNSPDLQQYLQQHPEIREEFRQNPNAFMRQEERFDRREDRDIDIPRDQLASFDRFLDQHPSTARQLKAQPWLVDDPEFMKNSPDLQQYLQEHPEIRAEFKANPNIFMHQEDRFDRREDRDRQPGDDDVTRRELARMDQFLDQHPEIAEQLRKNPSLADNQDFLKNHPELQQFLKTHSEIREQLQQNPNAFMHKEDRFDQREASWDRERIELATFDRFLDSHPEIAEQLRKNPSLADNKDFLKHHPALQDFLAQHPGIDQQFEQNPVAYMQHEEQFDRSEQSGMRRDHDVTRAELSSFHDFLEGHGQIAGELSKNPSLAKNEEFLENHPELQQYLKAHPEVHEELNENPQSFLQFAQQFGSAQAMQQSKSSKALSNPSNPR